MKYLIVIVVLLAACTPVKNDCFKTNNGYVNRTAANNVYDQWDIACR